MPIEVVCPGGHRMNVAEKYAGKKIRCPKCSQETVVPQLIVDSNAPVESLAAEKDLPVEKPKSAEKAVSADKLNSVEAPVKKPVSPQPIVKKPPANVEQNPGKESEIDDFGDLDEFDEDLASDALEPEDDDFDLGASAPSKKKKTKGKKAGGKNPKPATSRGIGLPWIIGGIGAALVGVCAIVVVMNQRGPNVSPQPSVVQTPPDFSPSVTTGDPVSVPANPIPIVKERPRVSISLPANAKQLVVGGSGNYLVAAMPAEGLISIVDVRSRTIGNPIKIDDTEFLIAAGESKFVVVKQNKNQIARYDLGTGAFELSTSINPLKAVAMGCSSEGPVFGIDRQSNEAFLLQLTDLQKTPAEIRNPNAAHKIVNAAASADGKVFSVWNPLVSPCGVNTVTQTGPETWVSKSVHNGEGSSIPSADGQFTITSGGRFDNNGKQLNGSSRIRTAVPSATGPVYLDFNAPFTMVAWQDAIHEIQLRSQYDDTVLTVIKDITFPGIKDPVTELNLPLSQRLYLLPKAN